MSEMAALKAPFPWFGGKRRVADVVWRAFGDCPNYIEPFFGSGAVMLGRPHEPKIETANDSDAWVANFWRAVTANPDEVAAWADWPVSEIDLHARHRWLSSRDEFRERMRADPDFFDVKIAGWWVWGLCQWIGSGWCVEPNNHKHPKLDGIGKGVHSDAGHVKMPDVTGRGGGKGVHSDAAHPRARNAEAKQRPKMGGDSLGMGIHASRGRRGSEADWKKRPDMDGANHGRGVHSDAAHLSRQIPNLRVDSGASGSGVHASGFLSQARPALNGRSAGMGVHMPSLGNDRGLNGVSARPCTEWFRELQARLRRVRFACGDWQRVLGPSVLGKGKNVGGRRPCAVFLDPPYSFEYRDPFLYVEDDTNVAAKARAWAVEHGDDPELRIALCGYWDEHRELMPSTWNAHRWKGARGYASDDNDNRDQETVWFSPHCLPIENAQGALFTESA